MKNIRSKHKFAFMVICYGLLGCSCMESSSSDPAPDADRSEAVVGDIEIKVVNPSSMTMMDFEVEFPREEKEFRFENVEAGSEFVIWVEDVMIPPDFLIGWHVRTNDGHRAGRTNWYSYGTYRSEEWDMEKTKFIIEFNENLSATSGRQE